MGKIVIDVYLTAPATDRREEPRRSRSDLPLAELVQYTESMRKICGEPVQLADGSQLWVEHVAPSGPADGKHRHRVHHLHVTQEH